MFFLILYYLPNIMGIVARKEITESKYFAHNSFKDICRFTRQAEQGYIKYMELLNKDNCSTRACYGLSPIRLRPYWAHSKNASFPKWETGVKRISFIIAG